MADVPRIEDKATFPVGCTAAFIAAIFCFALLAVAIACGGGFFGAVSFGVLARRLPPEVALGALAPLYALAFVLFGSFFAVVNALNYLRARRVIGEPLDKALAEFERAVLPESHWKLAERERVATLIALRR